MAASAQAYGLPVKVIRDPVHNLISLSGEDRELVLDLIARPEFQRLRRVRQLGLASLIFPGAEHSRWGHSLGAFHVARRMVDALLVRYTTESPEGKELGEFRREILAAALLHDIGHGPFSHVFEGCIQEPYISLKGYPKDHEGWSERIIHERFKDVLERHGVRTDVVVGLISKSDRRHPLAKDFISSQLDADRMDYLLRDSRATGAKYGEFDLEWLLHSIRIGAVKVRGQNDAVRRLCFDSDKAVHVVEEYIQAREFMYVQVYIHKATRAYEATLKNVLGLATAITADNTTWAEKNCPPALARMLRRESVSVEEYLSLDDFRMWCVLIDWSHIDPQGDERLKRLRDKCARLVNRQRPYRCVTFNMQFEKDQKRYRQAIELQTELKGQHPARSLYLDEFMDLAYRNVFYRKSTDEEEQEDRVIQLIGEDGQTHAVESQSYVIRAISEIQTQIYRLYYDENDEDLMRRLSKDGWISENTTSNLEEADARL